jgi:dipeptidase D
MGKILEGLEPASLWVHFFRITQIPRCSKNEGKVRDYVEAVAARNALPFKVDRVGNIRVKKAAKPGRERGPVAVLQAHLDMVCEKNRKVIHDFARDPITLKREGDWLMAEGTSLGSDNGIGVAAALAIMEGNGIQHGPLEMLFTVDEETGLTGASALADDMLEGRVFFNLDSEAHGTIYIGCSGGRNTELFLDPQTERMPAGWLPVRVTVGGLQGGHSGLNIHEGRGNAIKLLARFLLNVGEELDIKLSVIDGGDKVNAIPRECEAIVCISPDKMEGLKRFAATFQRIYKEEYGPNDRDVLIHVHGEGFKRPERVLLLDAQHRLLDLLYSLPNGVIAMSRAIPGLVQTSSNLGVIKVEHGQVHIGTSQRSSVETELAGISDMVAAVGRLARAKIQKGAGYPGWQPDPRSPALQLAKKVFLNLFGHEPQVTAIHAGLECGIIGSKYPGMDMLSFGPTILGAHSPNERILVPTVEQFWRFLVAMLENLPGLAQGSADQEN